MNGSFQVGEWLVEPQINAITSGDIIAHVEPKVMQVLVCLAEQAGEVVSKERLIKRVWGDAFVTDDVLTRSISELRKAFGDDAREPRFIQTIPRNGYRLIAAVSHNGAKPDIESQDANSLSDAAPSPERVARLARSSSQDATSLSTPATLPRPWWRTSRLTWLIALLAFAIGGAAWLYFSSNGFEPSQPLMRVVPFTSLPGREEMPAFSPDGNQIAFVSSEKGDVSDIYIKSIGGERPLQLTSSSGFDIMPTWSPDGQRIAFVRFSKNGPAIFVVSALGNGPERKLLSLVSYKVGIIAWSPDGKYIACPDASSSQEPGSIILFSPETGEKRTLTSPPSHYWGDHSPAFSPDSQTLAFIRQNTPITGDIHLVPIIGGEPRRLTFDNAQHIFPIGVYGGLAWTADGREIIFSSDRGGISSLWRISVSGGNPERLAVGADNAFYPTISRQGHRLAYTQITGGMPIYRIGVPGSTGQPDVPTRLIASTRYNASPQYSPDGKRIVFDSNRSGSLEIWMSDSEGSNLIQLTSFGGGHAGTPRWSPDSKQIAFDFRGSSDADIYVISVEGGLPRRITTEPSDDSVPSWSRDGRYIYFASNRSGDQQVWKVPVEGGQAVQVTRQGGFTTYESADGKYLYYSKSPYSEGSTARGIWRVPVEGGEESLILDQPGAGDWGKWTLVDDGIYFINQIAEGGYTVEFFGLATHRITRIAGLEKVNEYSPGLAVSPDRRWILYTQQEPISSDIMLVENFR